MPFQSLGLGPRILRAIQEAGYAEPTPIQTKAIPVILKGRDVIATAQTGTGKTAAYVWPIIQRLAGSSAPAPGSKVTRPRRTRVLVLVPTRELAVQVEESVRVYGKHLSIQCAAIYGGVSDVPQFRALRAGVEIVIATPGRLLDLLNTLPNTFRELDTLVLDEADRMLDMGFLPDIRRIVRPLPKERQTLLFSATFSDEIEKVSREFLHSPETVEVGRRAAPTHTVTQFVYEISPGRKIALLLHLLKDENLDSVLVFTRTKRGADKLARRLEDEGLTTATLHSNKSQSQRQAALKGFKSGRHRVLVATDIAARGIDVDGISHVVNYDFPAQAEDYVHRIGRTGRAAAVGEALSFVTPEDHGTLRSLERFIGRGIPRKTVEGLADAPAPPHRAHPREEDSQGRSGSRQGRGSERSDSYRGGGGPGRDRRPSAGGSRPAGPGRERRPQGSGRPQGSPGGSGNGRTGDARPLEGRRGEPRGAGAAPHARGPGRGESRPAEGRSEHRSEHRARPQAHAEQSQVSWGRRSQPVKGRSKPGPRR